MSDDNQKTASRRIQGQTDRERGADRRDGRPERDVGNALRSVYASTVDEGVPDELLDLLGKLD